MTDCVSTDWLRDSTRHFGLPSFQPALSVLAMPGRSIVDCTPGRFAMRHENSSMVVMTAWSTQPSGFVSAMTLRMSTPIENFDVMTAVSTL